MTRQKVVQTYVFAVLLVLLVLALVGCDSSGESTYEPQEPGGVGMTYNGKQGIDLGGGIVMTYDGKVQPGFGF